MNDYRLTVPPEQKIYLNELITEAHAASFLSIPIAELQWLRCCSNDAPDHQTTRDGSIVYTRGDLISWFSRKKSKKK